MQLSKVSWPGIRLQSIERGLFHLPDLLAGFLREAIDEVLNGLNVYSMALSFMKNEADAEDVAQEAFIRAYRNLSSFRADAKFGTWLISITLNEVRYRLRKQALMRMELLDEKGSLSPVPLHDWREIPSEAL